MKTICYLICINSKNKQYLYSRALRDTVEEHLILKKGANKLHCILSFKLQKIMIIKNNYQLKKVFLFWQRKDLGQCSAHSA